MDIAPLGFEIDSSQARTAATDLAKLNAAAVAASGGADKLNKTLRDAQGRFKSSYDVAKQYGNEVRALADKYNPALSAVYKYQAAQEELNRAVALGVVTQNQADAALSKLQTQMAASANAANAMQSGMARSGVAADRFGQSMAASSQHTTNLMFQFQDIGMMLAAGQNPLMLAMQQGTQVSGVFHQMKQSGQSAFQGIIGGLGAMINPMSLLTIGAIAGGAALVQWGMSALGAGENAQTFHDAVDKLETRVDELNESVGLLAVDNYDKMLEKYGTLNQAVYDNVQMLAGLNAQLISISQISLDGLFSENFGGYLTTRVDEMRIAFETTNDQAGHLVMLMNEVAAARGPDQLISSMTRLRDEMIDTAGGVNNLTTKQAEFVLEIERSIQKAMIAKDKLNEMEAAAPDGSWMNPAIGGIDALIARANAAINRVTALRATVPGMTTGSAEWAKNSLGFTLPGDELLNLPSGDGSGSSGAGSGGGGGGGGGSDPYADNLNRLIESLRTERETVDAWYNENLTILNDRRALEIMGETAHKDALLDLEREYLDRKAKLGQGYDQFTLGSADKLFGELYSLSGSGYEGLLKLQKSFGASQALVNTYTAASQVLADPKLGFFAKFAAVAKTVAAGIGLVNAIKGGGSSGGGGGATGSASAPTVSTAQPSQPEKVTRIELAGEDWLVAMVEPMIEQIYKASGNGRVIVARG